MNKWYDEDEANDVFAIAKGILLGALLGLAFYSFVVLIFSFGG